MPLICLATFIAAPPERVFQLSRSIDVHKYSMQEKSEQAISGTTSGFLGLNETVTWQARHLFRVRLLTVQLTQLLEPHFFVDEQVQGDFKSMKHEHYFKPYENGTLMTDQFHFETPYGIIGSCFNALFLKSYMERLLTKRNEVIKKIAEISLWKQFC